MVDKNKEKPPPQRRRAKPASGPLYPPGTPLDENGAPRENVTMSAEDARRIGAYDAESAHVTQQVRNQALAKQRGEYVSWNADPRIALSEMYREHPSAYIEIKQIYPHEDDSVPSRPLGFIQNYDGLRKYLTEAHWNRKIATYQWWVRAPGYPQIGTGKITFAEVDDMRQNGNGNGYGYPPQQQQYVPPQQQYVPPQQQYAPPPQQQYAAPAPQYAAPQPQQQYAAPAPQQPGPPHGIPLIGPNGVQVGWQINGISYLDERLAPQPQQVQQPQPQPQPQMVPVQPPPQPAPQGGLDQNYLVTQLVEMARQSATFNEQLRQLFQQQQTAQQQPQHPPFVPMYPGLTAVGYGTPPGLFAVQQQPQQVPQPVPPVATPPVEPPPPPPSALEMMQRGFQETTQVMQMQKKFVDVVRSVAGIDDAPPEPPAPIAQPEEDFPLRTREVNGVTVGSIDGEMLAPGQQAMLNIPKGLTILGGLADKLFDKFAAAKGETKQEEKDALERKRAEVELEERQTKTRIEAQREKVAMETAKLQIRAAHVQLDTMGVEVQPPPPPAPPEPPVPPPAPPAPIAKEPENTPVPVPPNGATD